MIEKKFLSKVISTIVAAGLMVCFSSVTYSQITLDIRDGSGIPGSSDNLVEVSLDNLNDKVKGVSVDVCDVDNYLTCTGCETTDRTPGFWCSTYEMANGCVRVLLFSTQGSLIEEGSGPVFTIKYEVSGGAPSAGCKDLNPEEVSVVNEEGDPFPSESVTSLSGKFCFLGCTADEDCDDDLFCNGEETCDTGTCQDGTYPCQTPPNYSCDEETDQCIPGQAPVFITVEDGSGLPGSSDNPVDVSMENLNYKVKGITIDVCDVDNYLACTGCETTDRTPGFWCSTNEMANGCVRVLLFSTQGNLIEEGSGPVFTIKYEVSGGAPSAGCRDLIPEEVSVVNEEGDSLQAPVILGSGKFCFFGCANDEDCSDSLFCNGEETCEVGSGTCRDGAYPCQTPPNYSCDEETDQCMPGPAPVFLTIGDGSGLPGSTDNLLDISLENIADKVKGVSIDVCDVDNYLTCTGCETTDRTPGFWCSTYELADGCVRVLFFSTQGGLIEEGSGPIFTLKYDASEGAPEGECRDLNPEGVSVVGEDGDPLQAPVILESGRFCFFYCTNDEDCDDGLFCNGEETCAGGFCQAGSDPCPDDGLFCNGVEGCDEDNDMCTFSGNPCPPPLSCNEEEDVCNCFLDSDCDDGLFCNGEETCVDEICQPGTNPCPETECNTCQEDTDSCYDPYGTSCDDGLFCNGDDTCDGQGSCVHSGNPCPPLATCNEEEDVCNCSLDSDCDDGLFCNGEETCVDDICQPGTYPCPGEACDEETDQCKPVTVIIGNGSGFRGSTDNPVDVSMDNTGVKVRAVSLDVCDVDDYLTCTGCETTDRTSDFNCSSNELTNGCCRVVLVSFGGDLIEGGTGPVSTIRYDVSEGAPGGECRDLNPQNVSVADEYNQSLNVTSVSGEFCFNDCSSQTDCDDGNFCTDDDCNGMGACVYSNNNNPCDDGIYCNGYDNCSDGSCSAHTGDPCPSGYECNEETDSCDLIVAGILLPDLKKTEERGQKESLVISVPYSAPVEEGWNIEEVDITDDTGLHASLALDENGNPHISYYGSGNLKYAYYNGSSWHREIVDSVFVWDTYLALDENGNPHISYFDWLSYNLKYAYYDGSWHRETVDNIGTGAGGISLALDKNGKPHISYYNWSNGDLLYTYYDEDWHTETVDNISNILGSTTLALDENNSPHIGYYDWFGGDLKYSFNYITVDNMDDVGWYTSLALDKNGNPHISYYDNTNGDLKYAYYYSGWYKETVDSDGDVGWYTSLALDKNGNPHISYYDNINGDLKYAYYYSGWYKETVDSDGDVGWYTSLALDKNGNLNISYYDNTNGDLKYAFKFADDDFDNDGILNNDDNCPKTPNGLELGTCAKTIGNIAKGTGVTCTSDVICGSGETCQKNQEDCNGNLIGDVCECYADLDEDGLVYPSDLTIFVDEYERDDCFSNPPCQADLDGDGYVYPSDLSIFVDEYGRENCPVIQ